MKNALNHDYCREVVEGDLEVAESKVEEAKASVEREKKSR